MQQLSLLYYFKVRLILFYLRIVLESGFCRALSVCVNLLSLVDNVY